MKKSVVSYKEFKISKINSPEFSHLLYLISWLGFFVMYYLTERFIKRENCFTIHSSLDDLIPFNEIFIIPYVFWYFLIVASLLYFLKYNIEGFKQLQTFIIVTQIVAMVVYVIFPNCQNMRPNEFERNNILTRLVGYIYAVDTSTNVCPSLHVAYSVGIASAFVKEKDLSSVFKVSMILIAVLISISTVFVKQHSIIDVLAAIPLCVFAEVIAYRKIYFKSAGSNR